MAIQKPSFKFHFLTVFLIISLYAVGIFNEYVSCIMSAVLCIYICVAAIKNNFFNFRINLTSIAVTVLVFGYAVTALWAVDSGEAVIGFFKFLPLFLFMLAAMQQENARASLVAVPYACAVMTVVSAVLMQVPALADWFSVSGRLSGFLQYSNTFALLLLISVILLATKPAYRYYDYISVPVLIFGIIYSGSRSVFILTILSVLVLIIFNKNKKIRLALLLSLVAVVAAALVYVTLTDNFSTIGRFLTTTLESSTFLGRFLYFQDALPVILRHPFGLGYMGYYYMQQSFQTGVYSVMFIHNDFLQIMLDVGWVPAGLLIAAIIKSFLKKGSSLQKRLLIIMVAAHSCFDFDLQFLAVFMVLLLLLDFDEGKEVSLYVEYPAIMATALSAVAVICIYMGCAQALFSFHQNTLSQKLYPWNTQNDIQMLSQTNDAAEMNEIAGRILSRNEYVAVAYSAKSAYAYAQGNVKQMIDYKHKVFETAPFSYNEYEEYCYQLIYSIQYYDQAGDSYSADYCFKELTDGVARLQSNADRLSNLGKKIDDQPQTALPQEILDFIEAYA